MSQNHQRPEVEPLSDLAWARIERGLFQALDAGRAEAAPAAPSARRRWPTLAAGAGAAAVAAGILLVLALRGDGEPTAETETARVATEEAPTHFAVGDADLEVAPHSAILVDRNRGGTARVILERGRVSLRVAPRGDRPPLSVLAGSVRIEVVGTKFAVTRVGDLARVEVHEGVVRVTAGGEATEVRAGEAWGPEKEDSSAPKEEASSASDAEESSDAGDEEVAAAKPRPRPRAERRRRPRRAAPAEEAEPAPPAARDRFLRAARLEARDPAAASAIYRGISRAGGPWAAPALFARARLELDRGHRERADRLLRRYLERYPDGTNAADARALLDSRD